VAEFNVWSTIQIWAKFVLFRGQKHNIKRRMIEGEVMAEKEKRKNTTKEIFTPPTWIPSDVWDEWMTCRKKLKAQNTPRAMTILVKKLEQCRESGIEAKDAMETAIVRGWKSVEVDWLRRGQTPPEQKRASGREFPA